MYCIVDFETRSEIDISLGLTPYFTKAQALSIGVLFEGGKPLAYSGKDIFRICEKLLNFSERNYIVAHNAIFDFKMFQKITGCSFRNYSRWIDTSILSSVEGSPKSLSETSKYLNLNFSKDTLGKKYIKLLSSPQKTSCRVAIIDLLGKELTEKFSFEEIDNLYKKNGFLEHPELLKGMKNYCKRDLEVCNEIYLKLRHHRKHILRKDVFKDDVLNIVRTFKGVGVDVNSLKLILKGFLEAKDLISKELKEIAPRELNMLSPVQTLKFLREQGLKVENVQRTSLSKALIQKIDSKLKKFLSLMLAQPKSEISKVEKLLNSVHEGRYYGGYVFRGCAKTFRYTSRGFNLLSLPRGDIDSFDENIKLLKAKKFIKTHGLYSAEKLKKMIRHCFVSKTCFYGADFKQIDFRLLLLITGEFKILKKMYEGFDMYTYFASKVYGVKRSKISKDQRAIAKKAVLSFGYGVGSKTLFNILNAEGLEISLQDCRNLQTLYFKLFKRVKLLWRKLEIDFQERKFVELPFEGSRLYLNYEDPTRLYGGLLTGRVVQALTQKVADFTVRNLYTKLKLNCPLIFHDQVVVEALNNVDYETFKKEVVKKPEWLPKEHFPYVECEFFKNKRYI